MAVEKVIFVKGLSSQYQALPQKDENTVYWLTDTQEVYVGGQLFGIGLQATESLMGLMSPDDKKLLNDLVKKGVAISSKENNIIEMVEDETGKGLYASLAIKQTADGTYGLYHITADGNEYKLGTDIDIPKAFKSGSVETVEQENVPYTGAHVGDKYLDIVFDDVEEGETQKHLYIPVNALITQFKSGYGIEISDSTVSLKIDTEKNNGLTVGENGLALNLATVETAGALGPDDKLLLDSIPSVYDTVKFELVKEQLPVGYRVTSRDDEIRVMFPEDAAWFDQNGGGDKNLFYMGVRLFAPSNKVDGFKRGQGKQVTDDYVQCTIGGDTGGIDKYGRKFYIVWLPVAQKEGDSWTYLGAVSEEGHYAGWYITVEWYEQQGGKAISSETIRVNLSNERCHNSTLPYYSNQMSISWQEMG